MKIEKDIVRAGISFRPSAAGLQPSGFSQYLVIPNGAEGPVRDLTSDATIPAVNGIARLNPPPPDVIPDVIQ